MTEEALEKLSEYKYSILYYIYFITCISVALWIADPVNILSSLI
ncbi:MAG: hypothetical protein V5A88_00595 [Candidatus Thermoplasmatota archaeon]